MAQIRADLSDFRRLEQQLRQVSERALPYAARETVNSLAFEGRRQYQSEIRNRLTNRNRWTVGSVRAATTRDLNPRTMAARAGSTEQYMADQEFGALRRSRGKHGHPIPTGYAAGQAPGAQRTRVVRRANRLTNIRLQRRGQRSVQSRKQANAAAVQQAAQRKGSPYVFLDLGRRKGIFKVTGGKRRPKVRMVHDLSSRSVRIPAQPLLAPATEQAARRGPELGVKALRFQLERLQRRG